LFFAATKKTRLYSINGGTESLGPPAIDSQGNLYVPLPRENQILVYAAGTKKVMRKITTDFSEPSLPVFDSHDNLYVFSPPNSIVVEFAAGSSKPIRIIHTSKQTRALAVDPSRNLYVLSLGSGYNQPSITVFPPGVRKPKTTITDGLSSPGIMAFDSTGNLFVLNANDITAYTPGATSPYLTFDRNAAGTTAMAIDAANNLYVGNDGKGFYGVGSFKVYALGSKKLLRKVSRDVNNPIALAIGP
jgi:hypothetical protein